MNHGPFVFAAYAIVLLSTAAMLVSSFAAMRAAERRAERLSKRP